MFNLVVSFDLSYLDIFFLTSFNFLGLNRQANLARSSSHLHRWQFLTPRLPVSIKLQHCPSKSFNSSLRYKQPSTDEGLKRDVHQWTFAKSWRCEKSYLFRWLWLRKSGPISGARKSSATSFISGLRTTVPTSTAALLQLIRLVGSFNKSNEQFSPWKVL